MCIFEGIIRMSQMLPEHSQSLPDKDAPTVLLVDDEPHIRNVMSFKLRKRGLNVLTAENGLDGFDLARQMQPDLVVSDMQMPRCTGLEMCRMLAGDNATVRIPIIMVTSREFEIGAEETAGTNVRAVIGKPFSPTELLKLVEQHLPVPKPA
jgi:two-component system phosphate regulon response regulator PhoB